MTEHEIDEFLDMCSRVKEKVEHYNLIINKIQTKAVRQQVQDVKDWVADNQSFLYKSRATRTDLFKQAKKKAWIQQEKDYLIQIYLILIPKIKRFQKILSFIQLHQKILLYPQTCLPHQIIFLKHGQWFIHQQDILLLLKRRQSIFP